MSKINIDDTWSCGESMFDSTYYYWNNFFSLDEADEIIKIAESKNIERATTFDDKPDGIRDANVIWLDYNDIQWACEKMWSSVVSTNEDVDGWNLDVRGFGEQLQYTLYDKNGSYYGIHRDIGPGHQHRKISLSLQLSNSDDYDGGDVMIDNVIVPNRNKGDLIMFPSIIPHQVLPIKSGTRKSLVIWLSGPKLR